MSEFFAGLGETKIRRIRLALMDMWKPFRNATRSRRQQPADMPTDAEQPATRSSILPPELALGGHFGCASRSLVPTGGIVPKQVRLAWGRRAQGPSWRPLPPPAPITAQPPGGRSLSPACPADRIPKSDGMLVLNRL